MRMLFVTISMLAASAAQAQSGPQIGPQPGGSFEQQGNKAPRGKFKKICAEGGPGCSSLPKGNPNPYGPLNAPKEEKKK